MAAVVIPQKLVADVHKASLDQEELESWIINEVRNGAVLPGLYPPNEENKKRFDAFKKTKG